MRPASIGLCNYWCNYEFLEDKVNLRELRLLSKEQFKLVKDIIITEMEYKTWNLNLFRFSVTDINLEYNWISWKVSDKYQDKDEIENKYLKIFEDIFTVSYLNSIIEKAIDIVIKNKFYN